MRRRVRGSRLTVGGGGLRKGNSGSKPLATAAGSAASLAPIARPARRPSNSRHSRCCGCSVAAGCGDEGARGPHHSRDHDGSGHDVLQTREIAPGADPMAVVGSQLRVHGITGLRIADASIMPSRRIPRHSLTRQRSGGHCHVNLRGAAKWQGEDIRQIMPYGGHTSPAATHRRPRSGSRDKRKSPVGVGVNENGRE